MVVFMSVPADPRCDECTYLTGGEWPRVTGQSA